MYKFVLIVESIKLSLPCPEDVGKLPNLFKYCVCFLSYFLFLLSCGTSLLHLLSSSLVVVSCAQQYVLQQISKMLDVVLKLSWVMVNCDF